MERPRHKANNPKTLHPGHALGAVGIKSGGGFNPPWQTGCSLGQDYAALQRICHGSHIGRGHWARKRIVATWTGPKTGLSRGPVNYP